MTRKEIMKLKGRELDAAVAEHVMGWEWRAKDGNCGDGSMAWFTGNEDTGDTFTPEFSTDLNHCREAEMKMAEIGKGVHYVFAVNSLLSEGQVNPFGLLTAPAEVRCRAMLLAVKEATHAST